MRIILSDGGCLIDLRKAALFEILLRLPYEFLIPNTLFEDELLKFTAAQKRELICRGLIVMDLSGERVLRAQHVARTAPQISVHDAFAFSLAESLAGSILLADGGLRALAAQYAIEVHGVLWTIDEIHRCRLATTETLRACLKSFAADPTVQLPRRQLALHIRRYEELK
jgi:hypothetical protein